MEKNAKLTKLSTPPPHPGMLLHLGKILRYEDTDQKQPFEFCLNRNQASVKLSQNCHDVDKFQLVVQQLYCEQITISKV